MNKKEKIKKILSAIVLIIIIPILFINIIILIDSVIHPNEIPSFFGWKPFIVLSETMENEIFSGDIAVVKEVDSKLLKAGDIIAYKEDQIVILQRIEEVTTEEGKIKYKTKSDNASEEQYSNYVLEDQIEGIFKFRISRFGNFAVWIQTPLGMIIAISIPFLILIILQNKKTKEEVLHIKNESKEKEEMEKELEELRRQNELLKNGKK